MTKRVLFFFPHNPYPPRTGAHKRCLEMLASLRELGFQVTFTSSTLCSETKWELSSIQALKANWVSDVVIYEPTKLDYKLISGLRRYYRLTRQTPPISSGINTPFGMRNWFTKQNESLQPEIIFMNYAYWDKLLIKRQKFPIRKIIDIHDLITLNTAMQEAIKKHLPHPLKEDMLVDEQVLREDFFDRENLQVSPEEFSIYDTYNYTIVISSKETELVKNHTRKTQTVYIPVHQPLCYVNNKYEQSAIFLTGPNLFNLQGYLYFIKKILPLILQKDSTFVLQMTGACCQQVFPTAGIILSGFVSNLTELYEQARFSICPVFGGTGQQIKIVEAMAHGVPVVATHFAAERSPIIHNENGLIAKNAAEFAEYVLQLWRDKDLCKKLGTNARDTISNNFSREHLSKNLSLITHQKM